MRRSRSSTAPILNKLGKPRIAKETEYMRRVLTHMARYPWLRRDWIAALAEVPPDSLVDMFKIWKAEPNFYVKLADFQLGENWPRFISADLVYQPGPGGERLLNKHGVETNHDEWSGPADHRVDSCEARASFDLGLRRAEASITTFEEILAVHPTATAYIPTGEFTNHQQPKPVRMHADCNPFILNVLRKKWYFAGIERDRGFQPLNVIRDKCRDADSILKNETYIDHLEFPDLTFLFVTESTVRMRNMQDVWLSTVRPEHRDKALFKVAKPEATGWALLEPWQYADGTTINLITGEEVKPLGRQAVAHQRADNREGAR